MNEYLEQVSAAARHAVSRKNWTMVNTCATEILAKDADSPEGFFLSGLVAKAANRRDEAIDSFSRALELDAERYDAAIELAYQYSAARRNGDAVVLVGRYEDKLANSPVYLNMAGRVYSQTGMPERAWSMFDKANALQPGVDMIEANLASSSVFLGKINEARTIYERLLARNPAHQRNHLSYARLEKAEDRKHIEQMKEILRQADNSPDRNIFMYYAIGKELEDLEEWDEAFTYFKKAGDAVASVARYDVNTDLELIDKIIEVCSKPWLRSGTATPANSSTAKTPIFIVGLPRTGTTLADRIIASHSQVQSVGETKFIELILRRESGIENDGFMTPAMIEACAKQDIKEIGDGYMGMLSYRLGDEPIFIDKLPFNILYLGFISKAFPNARIIHMQRNAMDSCFSMYKQVFTGAYNFSYTLESLGRYYVAHQRLVDHWRETLQDRFIEVEYESLVTDQENQTRILLDKLGLDFEEACLSFDKNETATATASSVQVRQKVYTSSVDRWRRYERQLQPLREYLENAGIPVGISE
jgi:tetratricopeptide (TPR) repeat protein